MQNIIFYVSAAETLGIVRDSANAKNMPAPTLVLGAPVCLKMRVFSTVENPQQYPIAELQKIANWKFVMDSDFDKNTNYKLIQDEGSITVSEVTEEINEIVQTFTEISIPISQMDTVEIEEFLGTSESKNTLAAELCGYDSAGNLAFILQIKNFTIRNRLTSVSGPSELPAIYLTADQVRALIASGVKLQYSETGVDGSWHEIQTDSDIYLRFASNVSENSVWSDAVKIPAGKDGTSSYTYIAYASNANGDDFSLTASDNLAYIAFLISETKIESPSYADFQNVPFVKFIGGGGAAGTAVDSVNGKTGTVTLNFEDVGADQAGTAESKVTTHNSAPDAHSTLFAGKIDTPAGGTTGQVLAKTESGVEWKTIESGNGISIRSLFANPVYFDTEEYCLLDDVNTEIQTEFVYNASTLKLVVSSADSAVTGNIVITAGGQTFTVAAGNAKTLVTLNFTTNYTGTLILSAVPDSADWTLKDGGSIVSAKIYVIYAGENIE